MDEDISTEKETYYILIHDNCSCTLSLSIQTLIEIGLKPAVDENASMIVSILTSNDFFGLYEISALLIIHSFKAINNSCMQFYSDKFLREKLLTCLQVHRRKTAVFLNKAELFACNFLGSWIGRGGSSVLLEKSKFSQVSSCSYLVRFNANAISPGKSNSSIYLDEGNSYRKIEDYGYVILEREDTIPFDGLHITFISAPCTDLRIGIYMLLH